MYFEKKNDFSFSKCPKTKYIFTFKQQRTLTSVVIMTGGRSQVIIIRRESPHSMEVGVDGWVPDSNRQSFVSFNPDHDCWDPRKRGKTNLNSHVISNRIR